MARLPIADILSSARRIERASGAARYLTVVQLAVLDTLRALECDEPSSVADIRAELERIGAPLGRVTVNVALQRLCRHGMISRVRRGNRGRAALWSAQGGGL